MKALKNILNKLYSEDNGVFAILKTENKLELSAISDLESVVDQAEQISEIAVLGDVLEKADELINLNSELEVKKENFYTDYQSLDADFFELKDKIELLEQRFFAYADMAEELGIDPNNSDVYRYADTLLNEMQNQYREYDKNFNRINEAFTIAE
jgi:predicted nuclease with TOPRIM domain